MSYWYRTGTISVANGSTTVTGTLTSWNSTVRAGDMLHAGNNPAVEIASVTDNTHFELVEAWPYTTLSGANYGTELGPAWNDVTRLANDVATALANSTEILSGTGVPSDAIGSDGSAYFRQDAPELYFKSSGTWGSAISLTGPTGPQGANNITSSTTSRTLNTGSMSFTVDSGKAIQSGMRMRVSNSGSNYMEGVVTSYSGASLTISMDRFVGSGTYAVWAISPVGDKGDIGATGASYAGTSTTSLAIGTGSKSFTTQSGMAYVVGSPIRLASNADATNFMEGIVASYSTTSMTITVSAVGGSGTFADWNITLVGRQGATGPTGSTGSTGATGPAGPGYAATSTTSNTIGTGNQTFTTQSGLSYVVGSRARAADASDPASNWMEGVITAYSSTSMTIAVDRTLGSGTISSWNISLIGQPGTNGTDGVDGNVYNSTSATSFTPVAGSKTFTVASGLSYVSGQRLRGASAAAPTTNWFSGIVTSYSGTSLIITVDVVGPSAAAATDWNIALTGEKGDASGGNVTGPGSSVDQHLATFSGTGGTAIADSGVTAADIISAAVAAATAPRNRVVNPQLFWAQTGVGSITDGNYSGIDQWYVLTQTAAVSSSQLTGVANGVPSMGRLTQSQATAQRMGWAQVFENAFVSDMRGKTVTLAAKVRMSAATTIRYAIIEWTGTADTVTKDVVNSWTNTTFTAGQFFASSNLTIAAIGSLALSASAVTDVTLSASISSSMNNIIIFFWTDSAQAQTVTLDIGNVFFGQGSSAPATFEPPAPDKDLFICQRYFERLTWPSANLFIAISQNQNADNTIVAITYAIAKRVTPSLSGSSASTFRGSANYVSITGFTGITFAGSSVGYNSFQVTFTKTGAFTAGGAIIIYSNAAAYIDIDARL